MSATNRVRDAGFPRVADLLERDNLRAAWAELRRFEPASFGEAVAHDRAKTAMPRLELDDDGNEIE